MTDVPGERAPSLADRAARAASNPAPEVRPVLGGGAAAALAGAVAAAVAIGASELLAGVLPGAPSLVVVIGQAVIDLQPPGAKDVVVGLFGTNDKLALEIFIVAVTLAIAAALGVVARRRFGIAALGFVIAGIVAAAAALRDPRNDPMLSFIAAAVSTGAGLQALSWLVAATMPAATPRHRKGATSMTPDWSRRAFLGKAGALVGVAAGAGIVGHAFAEGQRTSTAAAETLIP